MKRSIWANLVTLTKQSWKCRRKIEAAILVSLAMADHTPYLIIFDRLGQVLS